MCYNNCHLKPYCNCYNAMNSHMHFFLLENNTFLISFLPRQLKDILTISHKNFMLDIGKSLLHL